MTMRRCTHILFAALLLPGTMFAQKTSTPEAGSRITPRHQSDILPDEDGGQVRILPVEAAAEPATERTPAIRTPLQQSVFLGSGWAEASARSRKAQLAGLLQNARTDEHAALRTRQITAHSRPAVWQDDFSDVKAVTDLQMQARLAEWIHTGVLTKPDQSTIYVIYLAPGVQSTLRGKTGGKDYLAYYNLIHLDGGEVRYVVVPYEADAEKQRINATKMFVETAIDPAASTR